MKHDYLIVGAGLFGSVFAHEMTKRGKRCLVIDQRDHIAGNVYTEDRDGIQVHCYGPHIFHTNSDRVWRWVNQFAKFNNFVCRTKANHKGRLYSLPVNLMTFHQVAGCTTPAEAQAYLDRVRVKIDQPKNMEEWAISQVGPEIYELLFKGYTKKQWMREPKELPASILQRLPIRLTHDDNYFDHPYQGIPIGGYTKMVMNMLVGVEVELGVRLEDIDWKQYAKRLVYTGPIDAFFDYSCGELDYRTLEFDTEKVEGDFQGNAIINYTEESVPYTRIIEHKHFEFGTQNYSYITKEYPVPWRRGKTPYYPINNQKNSQIYMRYAVLARGMTEVIMGGRLAEYKYFDMDQTIASALTKAEKELCAGG